MKWPEIDAYLRTDKIALVPIGAAERHGGHFPLMVDTARASGVAEGAAVMAKVLAAPPLHSGRLVHHMGYPGYIALRLETLTQAVQDIGLRAQHRFRLASGRAKRFGSAHTRCLSQGLGADWRHGARHARDQQKG